MTFELTDEEKELRKEKRLLADCPFCGSSLYKTVQGCFYCKKQGIVIPNNSPKYENGAV